LPDGEEVEMVARCVLDGATVKLSRPRRRGAHRGFTLVELMIVVAIVGVMSALALYGYRKYINSAQSSEAKTVIQMIRGAQEAYKSEMLQYLNASSSITSYYPNTNPQDERMPWVNPNHADYPLGWKLLNISTDAPVRFGYACTAGIAPNPAPPTLSDFITKPGVPVPPSGAAWYAIQAKDDHNKNGVYALFGAYSPVPGYSGADLLSENEDE
jgi:type IV pilus assembly protein PilA